MTIPMSERDIRVVDAYQKLTAVIAVRKYAPDATDEVAQRARALDRDAHLVVANYGTAEWVKAMRVGFGGVRVVSAAYFDGPQAGHLREQTIELWARGTEGGG